MVASEFTDSSHSFYPLITHFYMLVTFSIVGCDVYVVRFGFVGKKGQPVNFHTEGFISSCLVDVRHSSIFHSIYIF